MDQRQFWQGLRTGALIYAGGALLIWSFARSVALFLGLMPPEAGELTWGLRPTIFTIGMLMLIVTGFAAIFAGGIARDRYGIAGLILTTIMLPTIHRVALITSLYPQEVPPLNPFSAPWGWAIMGFWLPLIIGTTAGWWSARNADPLNA